MASTQGQQSLIPLGDAREYVIDALAASFMLDESNRYLTRLRQAEHAVRATRLYDPEEQLQATFALLRIPVVPVNTKGIAVPLDSQDRRKYEDIAEYALTLFCRPALFNLLHAGGTQPLHTHMLKRAFSALADDATGAQRDTYQRISIDVAEIATPIRRRMDGLQAVNPAPSSQANWEQTVEFYRRK